MNNDYEAFIEKYIPSADVRTKIRETGHIFSDWDCATIIWNSTIPLMDKHREIRKIADETPVEKLREQILERLSYDKDALDLFKGSSKGYIYVLNSHKYKPENDIEGYFASCDLAYEEGCKLGFDFSIAKHQVIVEGRERTKAYSISSPVIEPDKTKQIVTENYYSPVVEVEYDKNGSVLSYWTHELPKDRTIQVETLSNKRFENRFVVLPNLFEINDKVRIVGMDSYSDGISGWINAGFQKDDEFIRKATAKDAVEDYSDASLEVSYWSEDRLAWDHKHILPIYLERVSEDLCNSFDDDHRVAVGHDYGNAVWFQIVEVNMSEKILSQDVKEIGKEISVERYFFDRVLKQIFVREFDADMPENKNRYTHAFSDEGCYLNRFEEDIIERNFYTYEQMEKILEKIEDCVKDGAQRIEKAIGGTDAIQMITLAAHLRLIMEENPNLRLVSVMS